MTVHNWSEEADLKEIGDEKVLNRKIKFKKERKKMVCLKCLEFEEFVRERAENILNKN